MPSTGHQNYLDKSLESYLDIYLNTRRNTEVIELFVLIKRLTQKESNYLLKYFCKGSHGFGYFSEVLYILSQI